jgi:hypothetical protein
MNLSNRAIGFLNVFNVELYGLLQALLLFFVAMQVQLIACIQLENLNII